MLAKLNLSSLAQRKDNMKLVTFHETINQQIQIPNSLLILTCGYGLQAEQAYSKP